MTIDIRVLSPELLDDYLNFFDNIAFIDHKERSECYCVHFHWDASLDAEIENLNKLGIKKRGRDFAIEFVGNRTIQGYLAYMDNEVIGWCNANNKTGYKGLVARSELWADEEQGAKVKAVTCFTVAPNMRGKGIATQLLKRVCTDAEMEGYSWVEAYPANGGHDCFRHYHGPYMMYDKCGFQMYKELDKCYVVRKYL